MGIEVGTSTGHQNSVASGILSDDLPGYHTHVGGGVAFHAASEECRIFHKPLGNGLNGSFEWGTIRDHVTM